MTEGTNKWTFQENFTIGYSEIYGDYSNANLVAPYNPTISYRSIPLGGSIYNFQRLNQNLVCYFDVNLNPINNGVKTLSIKYINSCLTAAGGYLFQLSCPQLFRTPVQFIDGSSAFAVHTEYLNQPLPTNKARFTLTMISGPKPNTINNGTNSPNLGYQVPGSSYRGVQTYPIDNNNIWANNTEGYESSLQYSDFIINPAFGFAIEYSYF
jgi:hypothetical protein